MAASHSPAQPTIIAADSSRPFTPRLLIADILRTRYCVPGSILLVEDIESHILVSKRYRAVRLLLGDGELCVQTLLRPEVHRFVDSGHVSVGCYVQLNRFEVKSVLARSNHKGTDNGSEEPEEMVFLTARDLSVVGWNTAYMQLAGTTMPAPPADTFGTGLESRNGGPVAREEGGPSKAQRPLIAEGPVVQSRTVVSEVAAVGRNDAEMQQPRSRALSSSHSATDNRPWASNDISKPLKLTPLGSIPNLPYKQNWVVNVLAVVVSLSDVEPAFWPPYKQRTARLADPSTSKQVHLTVFLDPDEFAPAVGSVVLLLGVKNHLFDGGSLKKYANERPKDGSPWWLENSRHLDWCDVDGLEKWWNEQFS